MRYILKSDFILVIMIVQSVLIELDLNQLLEGGGPHTQIPQFNVVSGEKWIHLDYKKVFV